MSGMNLDNWKPFFKLNEDGKPCMSQQTYEPLLNLEGNIFCANYDWLNRYQRLEDPIRPLYTKEAVDYFFNQEIRYIEKYKNSWFVPEIIEIDIKHQRIFLQWHGESCNHIIYGGKNLEDFCPDWKNQIKNIELDLFKSGTYKLTMYPHCHFIDRDGMMKAIDWYGCVPVDDFWINSKYMDSIIHYSAKFRLEETGGVIDGKYNLKKMFQRSMNEHVKWGDQSLDYIYKEIFQD